MSEQNPYAAPQSELVVNEETPNAEMDLAERGTRFGASLLDGLVMLVPFGLLIGVCYAIFGWRLWEPDKGVRGFLIGLGMSVLASGIYFAINGRFLARDGQSIGKKVCNIRIVKSDGSIPTIWDSFFKRQVLLIFAQDIPFFGGIIPLVDAVMIFRKNKRCLHDDLAGTFVVKVR